MTRTYQDIKKTLAVIEDAWTKYPELRLGQLLVNMNMTPVDIFYVEDDRWEWLLGEFERFLAGQPTEFTEPD